MGKKFSLKVLVILSIGHMVTDIYQGALPAVLPYLKDKLGLTYAMTGTILMMSNFASSILQPLFGFYSDKKEKAILLPTGVLCAGVGFSLLSVPSEYATVLFLVAISGLGIAAYHPEGYKTAHFFTGERSVTGMAVFAVGGNLGFALGPIITLSIIKYLGLPALPLTALISIVFTVIIVAMRRTIAIPEDYRVGKRALSEDRVKGAFRSLFTLIFIVIMRTWTQMGLLTYIPFYYINYLKGDPLYAGKLVFTYLASGALGTLVGAPFADRWGHRFFVRLSLFLAALTLPLMFLVKGPMVFLVLGVQGFLLISTFSVTIVMAQRLLPDRLGIASGLMVGFAIGTGGIGVTLLGFVADHLGVPAALESIVVLPFAAFVLSLFLNYPGEKR
jgi:FSR family fosmidomycin resistance protein-like MFS transporter